MAARTVKHALLIAFAMLGVAALLSLGIWQIERREWKLALIERVESRVHAAPVTAPGPSEWHSVTAENAEYRRVTLTGRYLEGHGTLVQAVTKEGPGFWLLAPFQTDRGFIVLVNRGFVPPEWRDRAAGDAGFGVGARGETGSDTGSAASGTAVRVTGLLRMTEPKGAFLRTNDPARGRWYSRDVAAIAAAKGLSGVAPYFVDAEVTAAGSASRFPIAGLTVIAFRNAHLQYAITWLTLAAMLAGWTTLSLRRDMITR